MGKIIKEVLIRPVYFGLVFVSLIFLLSGPAILAVCDQEQILLGQYLFLQIPLFNIKIPFTNWQNFISSVLPLGLLLSAFFAIIGTFSLIFPEQEL